MIPSPCTGVCELDAGGGQCRGCRRSIEEIAAWGGASDAGKLAILQAVRRRREQAEREGRP